MTGEHGRATGKLGNDGWMRGGKAGLRGGEGLGVGIRRWQIREEDD